PSSSAGPRTRSDAQGRFEIDVGEPTCAFWPENPRWTAVFEPHVAEPDPPEGYVLVVAPNAPITGGVVDPEGRPIPGARVRVYVAGNNVSFRGELPFDSLLRSTLGIPMDRSIAVHFATSSDAEGRFRFEEAPASPGWKLVADASGFSSASVD